MLCGLQVCAMAEAMLIGKKSSNYFKTNILFLDKSREGNYKRTRVKAASWLHFLSADTVSMSC